MAFKLPTLPYPYDALEPYIDAKTMKIHHSKHHQAYLNKLNAALKKHPALFKKTIEEILSDLKKVPELIRTAVKNNGGGYFHHSFFWKIIRPNERGKPEHLPKENLFKRIKQKFNSFENFQNEFNNTAVSTFGSGWTWLSLDQNKEFLIHSTPNQDSPLSNGLKPLLGIDLWEHAYYLKYQNHRPEYIESWWHIINWEEVENNLNTSW